MELESNPLLERSVLQRSLSATMVIALVLAFLAGVTWFIRSFILPPRAAIPSPVSVAAEPAEPSVKVTPPAIPPPASADTSSEPSTARLSTVLLSPNQPDSAPPDGTVNGPSLTTTNGATDADPTATGSVLPSSTALIVAAPIAGPVPLPRPRRQASVTIAAPVPLPRPRPAAEETSAPVGPPIDDRHRAH